MTTIMRPGDAGFADTLGVGNRFGPRRDVDRPALEAALMPLGVDRKGRLVYPIAGGGLQTFQEVLVAGATDGPTLTAAARASCIPTASRIVLPNGYFYVGKVLKVTMQGRISCVVTTPGTARLDICLGSAGTTIVFDTLALNLNVVAKTTVPWLFEAWLTCRAVGTGTSTTFFGYGRFQSEAVVGAPLPAAGGNGSLLVPVGTPAVGAGFDNTAASALDVFFTQTVATGSFTVHNFRVEALN